MKYQYTVSELRRMESCPYLSDRERKVFRLYYKRGWQIEDIAAEMYVSRGTVKNILHSIRSKAPSE